MATATDDEPDTLPPPLVESNDPRLFNQSQLAKAIGVNREYITAMKRYGFKMPFGRATVRMAHTWLDKNAELVDDASLRERPQDS